MKSFTTLILTFLTFTLNTHSQVIRWISSTNENPWNDKTSMVAFMDKVGDNEPPSLILNNSKTYQTIDGFGGCFNDLGWQAILSLQTQQKREAVLKELFDVHKANFSLGRVPIGANDFSLGWYSFNETSGDYKMKKFSIERDRRELIPYIKAAMKYQPKLGIFGVPWCPPSWMTTSNHYRGGSIKQDAKTFTAYALYFSKYIEAYRNEGLNLYAVMPQNEPNYNNNIYPQCKWTGEELNVFLRDYLAPCLKQKHINIQLWHGTICINEYMTQIHPVLSDSLTNKYLTGVGLQYSGQKLMQKIHQTYPDLKISQTETECYNGKNTWDEGLLTYSKIIEDTRNFASSYFFWNMVLDESGLSNWNWKQNSLITIDRKKDTVTYNPEFFAMKHFSSLVLPGAKRIELISKSPVNAVAFVNPSGDQVVEIINNASDPYPLIIQNKNKYFKMSIPAKSMNTIVLED